MRITDFYTSHEALLLGFEQAMTRVDSTTGDWYALLGPHGLDRRPHPPADHAHVEYMRGIKNPIGHEVRPVAHADDLLRSSTPSTPRTSRAA
jgi:3-deoxy-7-phosphoheptulonate synthase